MTHSAVLVPAARFAARGGGKILRVNAVHIINGRKWARDKCRDNCTAVCVKEYDPSIIANSVSTKITLKLRRVAFKFIK